MVVQKLVIEESNPETTGIKFAMSRVDFSDTFSTSNHQDDIGQIAKKIFGTFPLWVKWLFHIRSVLVRLIRLKTARPDDYNDEFCVGGYVGFFRIFKILPDEMILGADDSHLNFRVSIYNSGSKNYNIKVTTLVKFNNFTGKFYMRLISPFHRLVVKRMVRQAYLP